MQVRLPILIEQDEDGIYVASCPILQGCYSQGDTYEEAVENIKEAIELYLESFPEVREEVKEILTGRVQPDIINVNVKAKTT